MILNNPLVGETPPPAFTESPIAWDSCTRNVTIGNDEGLIAQTTSTTYGCFSSIGTLPSYSHTHVMVCNSQACTNQTSTDTRRPFLQTPVTFEDQGIQIQYPEPNPLPSGLSSTREQLGSLPSYDGATVPSSSSSIHSDSITATHLIGSASSSGHRRGFTHHTCCGSGQCNA